MTDISNYTTDAVLQSRTCVRFAAVEKCIKHTKTPVRLLTTGCNTAIENLSKFLEQVSAPLTDNMRSRIKDRGHLLEIIDDLNSRGLPPGTILVSFDIVNMFPNIDNERGLDTLRKVFDSRTTRKPPTDCLVEALRICLYSNNSMFNNSHLLQTNGTATGAPNSCSYSDLALKPIDDAIFREAAWTSLPLAWLRKTRRRAWSSQVPARWRALPAARRGSR